MGKMVVKDKVRPEVHWNLGHTQVAFVQDISNPREKSQKSTGRWGRGTEPEFPT
jgi:hypothetical protein